MITSVTYPSQWSFVGNAITVAVVSDDANEIVLTLRISGQEDINASIFPYNDSGVFKGIFYLSELLEPFFKDIYISEGSIISVLNDFQLNYTIQISGYSGSSFSGIALWGGVDGYNLSLLKNWNLDMFNYRLMNYTRQFLFTTRTNGPHIVLRENELYPFVFIHPGQSISFVTSGGRVVTPPTEVSGTICLMDFAAVRSMIYDLYKELPSYIVVVVGGRSVFDLTLIPNAQTEESYLFRFKNSLGGYEHVVCTGKLLVEPEFKEEFKWQALNPSLNFEEHRERVKTVDSFTLQTGYKTRAEHAFILDMIKSNEIYYLDRSDPDRRFRRCMVSSENYSYSNVMRKPNSIQLKVRFVFEETFISPALNFDTLGSLYQNITKEGEPEWNGEGFIYGDDKMLYGQ